MEIDIGSAAHKLGVLKGAIMAGGIIRDEEGQINWSHVVTGFVGSGLVAISSVIWEMNKQVSALVATQQQRQVYVEQLPVIDDRLKNAMARIAALENEKSSATSDRFRRQDGEMMESRLMREITRLESRVTQIELKGGRR